MRGDAYDLQDLIEFTVTSIECIVLYPDVEKPNNSIATLKKSLIRIVAVRINLRPFQLKIRSF